jgi:hypothetical protein
MNLTAASNNGYPISFARSVAVSVVAAIKLEIASNYKTYYVNSSDILEKDEGKVLANEGFTTWFNLLPDDDWNTDFERATPIRWDPQNGWVED